MQKFRKQESTNISPRKVRFCLTSVLQIIIMKKLHRGVAQMVARMVRVHEAVGSTPATRTSKKCCNLSDYSTFSFFEYTLKYTLIYWDIFIESVCVGFRPPGKTILQHNIYQPSPLSGHPKRDTILPCREDGDCISFG